MATVKTPQSMRAAVGAKLARAADCVHDMRQAELPEVNQHRDPGQSFVDFLHSARGVVPVIETFADARQQPGDFGRWRGEWEARLSAEGRRLWVTMRDARVKQEHGDGAGLAPFSMEVARHMPQEAHEIAILAVRPGEWMRRGTRWKGGLRFAPYAERPMSEVCDAYLALCRRFAADFERENQHLF
jgi:hypothetical protein